MLMLNIFGWEVSILVFVLICCGALLLILAVLGLLTWLCCCCYGRQRPQPSGHPKGPPHPHAQVMPHSVPHRASPGYPPGYPPGYHPALSPPPPPPPHVALAIQEGPPPLQIGGPGGQARPGSPGLQYSPAVAKKWEEQLQATLFRKMSLEEVRASTGYFNQRNYVGEGAFAKVYRGQGPNGIPWAVKRSKQQLAEGSAGEQDFEKEVIAISRLSHKNLVRLLGYCVEAGEHILIYEYCPNGSLSSALYASRPELSFLDRLDIAIGTAEALYYLHSASSPPIIHRDVKPDNVFLDSQLQAKLGDFGLLKKLLEVQNEDSQFLQRQDIESVYTRIAGTPGYLDPEYHLTSKVTAKGDVYSFGVLLLQLCTGQRAILAQHPKFNEDSQLKEKRAPSSVLTSEATSTASSALASQADGARSPVPPGGARNSEGGADVQGQSPVTSAGAGGAHLGTRTAFAGLDKGGHEGGIYPGEPIHISTWLAAYVHAKVVEPVADARFGNNYNKTALFRMLEIGLLCIQPAARKRPAMSAVARWLHEVKEELERSVEEPEGQYSSVFAFDREALEGMWRGEDGPSMSMADTSEASTRVDAKSGVRGAAPLPLGDPSGVSVQSSDASFAQDGSSLVESARMTEGR